MINLKSMSLSALAVVQSSRAFSLNAASVSATRYRDRHHVPRTRCQHTAARRSRDGKQQVTRMEAGASPGSSSPVLGRGREVGRRNRGKEPVIIRRSEEAGNYCKADGAALHCDASKSLSGMCIIVSTPFVALQRVRFPNHFLVTLKATFLC